MLSRIQSLGSCVVVLTLLLFAGSAAAQDVSPRCEAAMDRATAHYGKCLLLADAHYARHENATKLENRQARCVTRFDRRTSRAINRHGEDECPSSDLVAAMEDRTVSYAGGAAKEASGERAPSYLYVQNAEGGTLTDSTLTLRGVSDQTGWFTDRPYRSSGLFTTEDFLSQWEEGAGSFADDPPNAYFTCEVDGKVANRVVELKSPMWIQAEDDTWHLQYSVSPAPDTLLSDPVTCDGDAHVFIDDDEDTPCYRPERRCMQAGLCGTDGFHSGVFADATAASLGCSQSEWAAGVSWSKVGGIPTSMCSMQVCTPLQNGPDKAWCDLHPDDSDYCPAACRELSGVQFHNCWVKAHPGVN